MHFGFIHRKSAGLSQEDTRPGACFRPRRTGAGVRFQGHNPGFMSPELKGLPRWRRRGGLFIGVSGGGEIRPGFSGMALALPGAVCVRDAPGAGNTELMMIRTIAAVLAAFAFVA